MKILISWISASLMVLLRNEIIIAVLKWCNVKIAVFIENYTVQILCYSIFEYLKPMDCFPNFLNSTLHFRSH